MYWASHAQQMTVKTAASEGNLSSHNFPVDRNNVCLYVDIPKQKRRLPFQESSVQSLKGFC